MCSLFHKYREIATILYIFLTNKFSLFLIFPRLRFVFKNPRALRTKACSQWRENTRGKKKNIFDRKPVVCSSEVRTISRRMNILSLLTPRTLFSIFASRKIRPHCKPPPDYFVFVSFVYFRRYVRKSNRIEWREKRRRLFYLMLSCCT